MVEIFTYESTSVQIEETTLKGRPIFQVSVNNHTIASVYHKDTAKRIAIGFIDHIKFVLEKRRGRIKSNSRLIPIQEKPLRPH